MTATQDSPDHPLYAKHAATIERAHAAIADRTYWSAFPESPSPKVYGETAAPAGQAAFEAYLGADFPLTSPAPTAGSRPSDRRSASSSA